jgi:tetratricopeptide (TPR) repeat protein/S1-C subfamily serine protease
VSMLSHPLLRLMTTVCSLYALSLPTVILSPQALSAEKIAPSSGPSSAQQIKALATAFTVKVFAGQQRGSGVILAKSVQHYTVVTNAHVIDRGQPYRIQTSDGKTYTAVLKSKGDTFKGNDLAVLEFSAVANYQVAQWGDSGVIKGAEPLFAAGFPEGENQLSVSTGQVSLMAEKALLGGYRIGFSNETQQGMSGGALLNAQGKVIGILGQGNQAILERAYTYQDGSKPTAKVLQQMRESSFAVPIATVRQMVTPATIAQTPQAPSKPQSTPSQARLVKPSYNGVLGEVDKIAERITMRIQGNRSQGSGVIVGKSGNTYYVLTNSHVILQADTYRIVTPDGRSHEATNDSIVQQQGLDVAILQFSSQENYQLATLSNFQDSGTDHWIFFSGFPAQAEGQRKLTLGRRWRRESGNFLRKDGYSLSDGYELVYTNLSLRGMSGGPILDLKGRVVGLGGRQEGEVYTSEVDRNLGYALGVPISNCLGLLKKAQIKLESLRLEVSASPKITELEEIEMRQHSSFTIEMPTVDSDENDWLNYGNQLWRVGRYEEAVNALNKAIALKPDFYQAYYALGLALQDWGKYQEAVVAFGKVTKLSPDYYEAWRGQSNALFYLRKYSEALIAIDKAIKYNSESASNGISKDYILYVLKANILNELKLYSDEEATLTEAIKIKPNYEAYNNRGNLYRELRRYQQADEDLNKAQALNPSSASIYNNRGIVYEKLGKYKQAEMNFNQAISLGPSLIQPYQNRGNFYLIRKKYQQAEADFTQAISIDPDFFEAYSSRGNVRINLKKFKEAESDLNRAIDLDSKNSLAYIRRGTLHKILKNYQQADFDYTQAIALASDNNLKSLAYRGRILFYQELKQYQQAEADCTKELALNPDNSGIYYIRGQMRFALKNHRGSVSDFTQAIKLDPKLAEAYLLRGNSLMLLYKDEEAKSDLNRASQLFLERKDMEKYHLAQESLKVLRSSNR